MKLRYMIPFFWSLCDIGSITADEKCNVRYTILQHDTCKKKKSSHIFVVQIFASILMPASLLRQVMIIEMIVNLKNIAEGVTYLAQENPIRSYVEIISACIIAHAWLKLKGIMYLMIVNL